MRPARATCSHDTALFELILELSQTAIGRAAEAATNLCTWLCCHYAEGAAAHLLERAHEVERGVAVQAGRGLVQHQDGGVDDQLHADGHAPALAAADAADAAAAAHLAARHVRQAQLLQHARDARLHG